MKARFLALWIAAVVACAAAFVVHLAMRYETVSLGYQVGAARKAQSRLIEQKRLLVLEAATLRQPDRIEAVARGSLQMEFPERDRTVSANKPTRSRVAGRLQ